MQKWLQDQKEEENKTKKAREERMIKEGMSERSSEAYIIKNNYQ